MKNLSISILNVKNLDDFLVKLKSAQEIIQNENSKNLDELFNISIHFDVMDNKFVPNVGVNIEYIKTVKKYGYYVDTHLMTDYPLTHKYIDQALEYGSDDITIHYECKEFEKSLDYLLKKKEEYKTQGKNLKVGIAIKPKTQINVLDKYISNIDKVLVMGVEPGFGGQKYIENTTSKIENVKKRYNIYTQVDGGINENTLYHPLRKNIDSVVAGKYITGDTQNIKDRLDIFNIILQIESLPKEANLEFESMTLQAVNGGYAQGDILLGIRVPKVRKLSKMWHKKISESTIKYFLTSTIHDYRRFGVFCLAYMVDDKNYENVKNIIDENIEYINNWDLVDSLAPICIGKQLLNRDDDYIYDTLRKYTNSQRVWTKRIGIVSLLYLAKDNRKDVVFRVLDDVFYEEYHLYQKATGWVLRELYKVNSKDTLDYLISKNNNKKIPSILKSYATEKMSNKEKEKLK